jgi:hypothetical protein
MELFWGTNYKNFLKVIIAEAPVTAAERSKACNVFARSEAGIWVRIPFRAWMFSVCVYVRFSVFIYM